MGTTKQVNIKNRTYYFYNDIIDLENVDAGLLKIDKNHIRTLASIILDMSQRKKFAICMNINVVNPLYLNINIWFLTQQMEIKNYLKNIMMFLMEAEIKLKR